MATNISSLIADNSIVEPGDDFIDVSESLTIAGRAVCAYGVQCQSENSYGHRVGGDAVLFVGHLGIAH